MINPALNPLVLSLKESAHSSLAAYYPEGTIVTGWLSKSFAAGGYRLGIMMVPRELNLVRQALKSVVSETFSAVSAPIQYAALAAYENFEAVRPYIQKTCDIYRFTSLYMHRRFIEMGLNCPEPEGSFYLFPDFNDYRDAFRGKGLLTGTQLCNTLLDRANFAGLPGSDFYLPATNMGVRVAPVDYDGAAVLKAWPGDKPLNETGAKDLFPQLVGGCDSLETFLHEFA